MGVAEGDMANFYDSKVLSFNLLQTNGCESTDEALVTCYRHALVKRQEPELGAYPTPI